MLSLLQSGLHYLGRQFISIVTRPRVVNPELLQANSARNTYYILENNRLSHQLLLKNLLQKQGIPFIEQQLLFADSEGKSPLKEDLTEIVATQQSNPKLKIQIIPVSIFHGRRPNRENSWLNLLCTETWHKAGPLGSFMQLLINGRQTLVSVDKPLDLQQLMVKEDNVESIARKTARVLRTHFSILRASIIGPDLSHRRTLISLVLKHPNVQKAIDLQAAERNTSRHRIERHCFKTLDKIAANYSPTTIRLLDPILNWVWKRLYNGVKIHNTAEIQEVSKTHQIIYLPCHRSHMDYLLFVFERAIVVPGSGLVSKAAIEEGLDQVFVEAGFEWRAPGCSMCLGMNPDQLDEGDHCASTSNRNFEGRQGYKGRTHLVSPATAAAAAVAGHFVDVRDIVGS